MRKVLVEVSVPSVGQKYDIFLPGHLLLSEATKMISKAAEELSHGLFKGDAETVLCNRPDGTILNVNLSVDELMLKNGSRLILV